MINLCKFCKIQGYSKEEYKNIKNNINTLSDALINEYFVQDAYYTITEIEEKLKEISLDTHKFYTYIKKKIVEKLY